MTTYVPNLVNPHVTLDYLLIAISNIEKYMTDCNCAGMPNTTIDDHYQKICAAAVLLPDENLNIALHTLKWKRLYALRRFLMSFNIPINGDTEPKLVNA